MILKKSGKLLAVSMLAMIPSHVVSETEWASKANLRHRNNRDAFWKYNTNKRSKQYHKRDLKTRSFTTNQNLDTRIVNGNIAQQGRYPYYSYLHMIFRKQNESGVEEEYGYTCGASLVAPNAVVTAAHCITEAYSSYYDQEVDDDYNWFNVAAEDIIVAVGIHDVTDAENVDDVIVLDVISIVIHPQFDLYSGSTFENDIALLHLDGYISEDRIRPIDMDDGNGRIKLSAGDDLLVIGFGRTSSTSELSYVLQQTTVDYITNNDCQRMWSEHITENIMCTYRDDTNACFGDSGGGLIASDEVGDVLVGIVSFTRSDCDYGNGYTRISKLYTWITENICNWSPCFCASRNMISNNGNENFITSSPSCHDPTPSPTVHNTDNLCYDKPDWLDSYGFPCDWYNDAPLGCALFHDCCDNTGYTPESACCKCGGGIQVLPEAPDYMIPSSALWTQFDGSPNDQGIMFDIVALKEVKILSIDIHVVRESKFKLSVYTKAGSFQGYESDKESWSSIIHNLSITGSGVGRATSIPPDGSFPPVYITQGQTKAFYVTPRGNLLLSSEGNGIAIAGNTDIQISEGHSIDHYFSPTDHFRKWNGAIFYSSVESVSPTISHSNLPSARPSQSLYPSSMPSYEPSITPSIYPTHQPTRTPSYFPSLSHDPTTFPSQVPTISPTEILSLTPSYSPTYTFSPLSKDSIYPSFRPSSSIQSTLPTSSITEDPIQYPSDIPSYTLPDDISEKPSILRDSESTPNFPILSKSVEKSASRSLRRAFTFFSLLISTVLLR